MGFSHLPGILAVTKILLETHFFFFLDTFMPQVTKNRKKKKGVDKNLLKQDWYLKQFQA